MGPSELVFLVWIQSRGWVSPGNEVKELEWKGRKTIIWAWRQIEAQEGQTTALDGLR